MLTAQVRRGELTPEQAARVFAVFTSRAATAPLVAIVQAPETWTRLSGAMSFESATSRFDQFLSAAISGHRSTGSGWAHVRADGPWGLLGADPRQAWLGQAGFGLGFPPVFFQQGGEQDGPRRRPSGGGSATVRCAPEATEWLLEETRRWVDFAERLRALAYEHIRKHEDPDVDNALGGGYGIDGYRMNLRIMAWLGGEPEFRRTTFKSKEPGECPVGDCNTSVTICRTCLDRTEIGNFLYGVVGAVLEFDINAIDLAPHSLPEFGKPTPQDWAAWRLGYAWYKVLRPRHGYDPDMFCVWAKSALTEPPSIAAAWVGQGLRPGTTKGLWVSMWENIQDPILKDCGPCTLVSSRDNGGHGHRFGGQRAGTESGRMGTGVSHRRCEDRC
jgi:hypothetical protein